MEFDYVIVGAGSAGCVLAARLSEDAETQVLVLEAGGMDRDPLIKIPLTWAKMFHDRRHDWGYDFEPEEATNNRAIECARGRVVGGSSSVNAMAFVRGGAGDYDRWAGNGLPDWCYAHALPYFRRMESWAGGEDAYRGAGGPVSVNEARFLDPLIEAYFEAAVAAGHARNPDYNGASQEGFGVAQQSTRGGRRESAATAYLHPARKRPNLTLRTGAFVTGIQFDGQRAAGVSYEIGGARQEVRAAREVILAGGVINSPQLLMLAGIGEADELRRHGIDVRVDLPGVGKNLQDHISAGITHARLGPSPFVEQMRLDRLAVDIPMAYLFGKGPATQYPAGPQGYLKLAPDSRTSDIQILLGAGPMSAHPWFPLIRKPFAAAFGARAVLLHPKSQGHLALASDDPRTPVKLHSKFLTEPDDIATLRAGFKRLRDIFARPELEPYRGEELQPGAEIESDADLDAYIRSTCITVHHPLGTCRMGTGEMAAVDPELRVRGAENLRVVDASVMPDMVSGNINAAVLMIAEKASDMIRGRPPLEPIQAGA
ncbi:MAG: GMC family oxidoreductase N-terminal domain-containing protein [Rhodospirillales bacterium]|jgi:choline dehydrogenase-like flavoprotein|nr:dehydrogenase [Rhodospirillaceae bacterium]MDP6430012.1 GMC family oxidoreductase N-terminal domain-containing protein [Rhodospirillales bacterium]MDP6645583.1 GMC family oxidoreductase N-terminal domain-containing protein [Rhodospirillales bacterium]|tara:strand:+ start:683 stop:2308 length:1626 start_codon:yes stop_codon:yes gene_type:complete